jgi:hypothetical protein
VLDEAIACQRNIRAILDEKVFKLIARWIKKSKEEGLMHQACMLHAHFAFLFRNVEAADLTPRIVFSMLSSQVFLFNNYKYDIDLDVKEPKKSRKDNENIKNDLIIPQVELFGMYQRHRRKILDWLNVHPNERNKVIIYV